MPPSHFRKCSTLQYIYIYIYIYHVIEKDTRRNILQKKWMYFILNTFYIYIYIYIDR